MELENLDLFGFEAHKPDVPIVEQVKAALESLQSISLDERVETINAIRVLLHEASPFKDEPVDLVLWVKSDAVHANDYNPNSVAPTEMRLLEHSIISDGYTQPIVTWPNNGHEVVDGFHRHRVGKECQDVTARIHGYLPVVTIKPSQNDRNDRMAATIRHNRARGEHRVDSMAEIVIELKRRFWSDEKIGKELGMEPDEVLRLTQITGLAALFSSSEFSQAWEATTFAEVEGEDELA